MAIKKEQKKFQDYTLDERKLIWDTLKEALDEGGHDILTQDVIPNLPEDEKEYMESEQFHGIAFDKDNFKDVYVINVINGNALNTNEYIDFDKIIEQGSTNRPQEKILQETPMDKAKRKTKIQPCIMMNEETGDEVKVTTSEQYDELLDKGYTWLYDCTPSGYGTWADEDVEKSKTKKSSLEDNYTFMGKPIGNCLDIADYIRTNRPDILDQIAEDYNVDVTDFDALVDFFVDTYQVFDEYEEYGITYRSPDLIMSDMEQELWHEPSGKVNWDKLRAYDELHNEMYGTHFIGSPELLDNEEARNITDAYRSYIAWNNHGNEPHWMEFPDSIFYAYTDPEEILTIMEEQGELEDYEEESHTKAIVDALRSLKKGKNMNKTKTAKAQILYGMMQEDDRFYKRFVELANEYCPHATKIYAGFSTDVVWDLPSGNHPGLFLNEHGNGDRAFYTCGMTAWKYLDFPKNTPDGETPAEMGKLAEEMYNKSNGGGISEDELIGYMKEMDEMCAELQNVQKSKTKKSYRVVGYDARRDYKDVLEQSRQNYQDARNPVIRYLTSNGSLDDNALGAKIFDSIDDAQKEADEWASGWAGQDGFAFAVVDEENNLVKSKTKKDEKKVPITDDDTVEIEEMDGKKYVEIEPKEEHAEEVETGYEEADDDLNTEENITHPDTSKPKETEKSKTKKASVTFKDDIKSYFLDLIDQTGSGSVKYDWNDNVVNISLTDAWKFNRSVQRDFKDIIEQIRNNREYDVSYFDMSRGVATVIEKSKTKKSKSEDMQDFGGIINVSRQGGDAGQNWDFMDYCYELEDSGDDSALEDLCQKIDAGKEKFTIHVDSKNWDYDITVIKSKTKKSVIDFTEGMTLKDFFEKNKRGGNSILLQML